jgi:SAM-dependent methyltransferase
VSEEASWNLGQLPFLWTPLRSPANPDGLPDKLPFTLGMNSLTGRLVQEPNRDVSVALAHAYSLGSMITGQMAPTGIGRQYTDDFLAFLGPGEFAGRRVLEIGCGNGYLLSRLSGLGARVLGLEPGEFEGPSYDVPIIRDFFPSPEVKGRFDTILMFGVLEHVENPIDFMRRVCAMLAPNGEVALGVPDCAPYIEAGDLSCLIHEHWSYFDRHSLERTLAEAVGGEIEVRSSGFGGLLHARVAPQRPQNVKSVHHDQPSLNQFRRRAERAVQSLGSYLKGAMTAGDAVGIYVPGRVINALFAANEPIAHCRFFDDNPLLKGTYFPAVPIPVEDRRDLIARPTDRVLIMSRSFGNVIAKELREQLSARVQITGWNELFAAEK